MKSASQRKKVLLWFVCGVVAVVLVAGILFLSVKPPRHLHLSGYSNWIECRSDTAGYRESTQGKVVFSTGLQGAVTGDFDIAMFIDSTSRDSVNHLMLYRGDTFMLVHHGETFPNTFKVTASDTLYPVYTTMHLTGNRKELDFPPVEIITKQAPFDASVPDGDIYIPPEAEPWPNLYLNIPPKKTIRISVVESPVTIVGANFLTSEFFAQAPQGPHMMPSKAAPLQLDSVHSIVFKITPSDSIYPELNIYSNAVTSRIDGSNLTIGKTTKEGDYVILTHTPFKLSSIYLNTKSNAGFDFALSPIMPGKDNFTMVGSATYIKISGNDIIVTIGKERLNLNRTDRLEIEGEFITHLYFSPPKLPTVQIDGIAKSVKRNNIEILPTRWESWDTGVRGPVIAALIAALATLVSAWLTANLIYKKKQKP